jgi:hypothetical protein
MPTTAEAKKAKPKKTKELEIAPEHLPLVAEVEATMAAMARKDADSIFVRGQELARVKSVLPEKTFGKWVKQRCGFTPRLGRMTIATFQNLSAFRDRLVNANVPPTVLYALSSASLDKVEEVTAVFDGGLRLTTAEVKAKLKPEGVAQPRDIALGGAAGLRRAAEAKMKAQLTLFGTKTKLALKAAEKIGAEIAAGKHVPKTKFVGGVERHCQVASDLLRSAIFPVQSASTQPVEWEKARQIISRLGDSPRWPGRTDFHAWVVEEVLPALRFVVHGTPISGEGTADFAELEGSSVGDSDDDPIADYAERSTVNDRVETIATAPPPARRDRLATPPALVPDEPVPTLTTLTGEIAVSE